MMGYYRDEAKTAEAMHDGWYHTGDIAWADEDGYYWYVGRNDDVIKSSGYRIGPFEVESVLLEHDAVRECAVTGVPDPVRGHGREGDDRARPTATSRASELVERAAGVGEGAHGAVQVPAHHRLRRRAAEDGQRQDPPRRDPRQRRRQPRIAGRDA